jgi:hypothetical protein
MDKISLPSFRRALHGLLLPVFIVVASMAVQAQQVLVAEGAVYFWRPGSAGWRPIEANSTLAAGDAVYAGNGATTEILIGPNDFLRLTSNTQVSLLAQDAGLMQFRVTSGLASFDMRSPLAGRIIEIDTPNAAFVLGGSGYYRVDAQPDRTRFVTRRGGRATLSLADGRGRSISANEEIVVEGSAGTVLPSRIVIETDTWDRWNDARSDYYATNGLGVVWVEIGRREPFGRPPRPAPRWEHHVTPPPPGGWARPMQPAAPMPIQPAAQPIRPPQADHREPQRDFRDHRELRDRDRDHRDFRDHRDEDRGRPGPRPEPATPPISSTIRPPPSAPVAIPAPVIPPPRPAPVVGPPSPAPASSTFTPPSRAPMPHVMPAPAPGPVINPAPGPAPRPFLEPPSGHMPGGDRPHHPSPDGRQFRRERD